jgi:O-antigen ligase
VVASDCMRRIVEAALLVAVSLAVLAFGGTAPQFFAITQGIILLAGIFQLTGGREASAASSHFPVVAPFSLIAFALLQIIPMPVSVASALGIAAPDSGHSYFTISASPYDTVSHLLRLVTCVTAFYLVLVLCEERGARKRLVFALLGIGVFEAFYGLIQYLTGWQQIVFYAKKYYLEEATGTYINRNHFAGLLEMILPFAVVLTLEQAWQLRRMAHSESAGRARRMLSSREFPSLGLWVFLASVLFAALACSRSRLGILSALVSLLVILVMPGSASLSARARLAVGAVFLFGIVCLAVWVGSDPLISRFDTLSDQYNRPGQDRVSIWRDTLQLIRRHPILGNGFGTFAVVYPSVQTAFLNNLVDHAHCDYLEIVSELGLTGGILLFGSIFWILRLTLWRCRKSNKKHDKVISFGCLGSMVAILLHSLADFNLYIPANALVFAIILALAWSSACQEANPKAALLTEVFEKGVDGQIHQEDYVLPAGR